MGIEHRKIRLISIGSKGQLGRSIEAVCRTHPSIEYLGLDRAQLDIREQGALESYLRTRPSSLPSVVVNCAAYTSVDAAESHEGEAYAVNAYGAGYLAYSALANDLLMIQISTDYVFDGSATSPIAEDAEPSPLSVYGETKYMGEYNVRHLLDLRGLVLRTSWLYSPYGVNFVHRMRELAQGHKQLRIVRDQIGSPTYAPHLAEAIVRLALVAVQEGCFRAQTLHYAGAGACSWYDLARATIELGGYDTEVVPITTAEYPTAARRPAYSVLSSERIGSLYGIEPQPWIEGLREYYRHIGRDQHTQ